MLIAFLPLIYVTLAAGVALTKHRYVTLTTARIRHASHLMSSSDPDRLAGTLAICHFLASIGCASYALQPPPDILVALDVYRSPPSGAHPVVGTDERLRCRFRSKRACSYGRRVLIGTSTAAGYLTRRRCVRRHLRSGNPLFGNHSSHLVLSRVRGDEGLDCFIFFIRGFVTCSRRRTPRPPAELATPGLINLIPAFSSAETSSISELTLPRTTPSLDSMRWMVGTERFARSAVCR